MVKRTNINLDADLVREAAKILGTTRTTDTVHGAMREVVEMASRRRLAANDFPDLTLESIEAMRAPRFPQR